MFIILEAALVWKNSIANRIMVGSPEIYLLSGLCNPWLIWLHFL